MSDSSSVGLAYIKETTFGVTPTSSNTFTDLCFTSESLRQDTQTTESAKINKTRQTTGLVRTGLSASGDVATELQYGAHDDLFEGALQSTAWSSVVTVSTTLSAVSSSNTITRASGSFVTDGLAVNQWVRLKGFAAATFGKSSGTQFYGKITVVTALSITLSHINIDADESSVSGAEVEMGGQVTNGSTFASYSIEKEYSDLTNVFAILKGMTISQMALNVASDAIITGSFTFLGKTESSASATAGTGTNTAEPSTEVMNAIDNLFGLTENGSEFGITGFTLQTNNNLRQRLQAGTLGPISIGSGTFGATGTLQAYFETQTELDRYRNFTNTDLAAVFEDVDGNAYLVEFPRCKYSSGQAVAGGQNQDVIADLQWTAFRHPTELITMRIQRWAA